MMYSRRRSAVAALATMSLIVAGCDGDDSGSDANTTTDTTTTLAPSGGESADPGDDPLADDEPGVDDGESSAGSGDEQSGTGDEAAAPDETLPELPEGWAFDGALVTSWAPDAAASIERTEQTTMPQIVQATLEPVVANHWIWDAWPLRDPDGQVAEFEGWTILFGLSAEITEGRVPGDRHGLATWRMMGAPTDGPDAGEWVDLGPVWSDGEALGGRQWAGSSVFDPDTGRITMYYTALGDLPSGNELTAGPATDPYEDVNWTGGSNVSGGPNRQEMVEVSADLVMDDGRPALRNMGEHTIILTADGEIYRTAEQAAELDSPYIFRDPWWYRDPESGREYILFSASPAFLTDASAGGVVGLAARNEAGDWAPLQPVLAAPGVNNQLERPHLVVEGDLTYLFVSTHGFSFLDGLDAPPGLYGFVSDQGLGGRFEALNESGLVLANPAGAEQQAYSWVVLPSGEVLSFANYFDLEAVGGLTGIADQSVEWQRDHFGGTLAPLVPIRLNGDTTTVL